MKWAEKLKRKLGQWGGDIATSLVPMGAACGKAFGNSFGAICLSLVFTAGISSSHDITMAMLTYPVLIFSLFCFAGVTFISLGMEGRKNKAAIKAMIDELLKREKKKKEDEIFQKIPSSNWLRKLIIFVPLINMYGLPLFGAIAKGATMAFTTYVILGVLFGITTGPFAGIFLSFALLCGFTIALISLGKEGKDTFQEIKKYFNEIIGTDESEPHPTDKPPQTPLDKIHDGLSTSFGRGLKFIVHGFFFITGIHYGIKKITNENTKQKISEAISWLPSLLAATGKGLGNAYGVYNILLMLAFLPVPWLIPFILVASLSEFMISINFEGNELRRHSQKLICDSLGQSPPEGKNSIFRQWFQQQFVRLPLPLRYTVGCAVPLIASIAKGATMGFGAYTTFGILAKVGLVFLPILTFSSVGGAILLSLIIFAGVAVALVSLTKEGKEFYKWAVPKQEKEPVEEKVEGFNLYQQLTSEPAVTLNETSSLNSDDLTNFAPFIFDSKADNNTTTEFDYPSPAPTGHPLPQGERVS